MVGGEFQAQDLGEHRWVLTARGEVDLSTTPSPRDVIESVMDTGTRVVVDLSAAEFIDSTTVNALVHGHRRAVEDECDAFVVVAAQGSRARRLLDLLSFAEVFPLYDSMADGERAAFNGTAQTRSGSIDPDF